MAQFLLSMQEKYIPSCHDKLDNITMHKIPLNGDQLFEKRARNTQWTFQDGNNPSNRLEGIRTEFADWHAKLNLFMVSVPTFRV